MSFLSSIGNAFKTALPKIASSVIKAVAPQATKLLQGIVKDGFQLGGAALQKLAGRLPGPFAGLAQKLLGAALPKLQNLAMGGVEKLIQKLTESITSRFAPGAGNVSLPGLMDAARQAALGANNPIAAAVSAATSAVSGAASAATAAPTSSTSSAATSSPAPAGSDLPPAPLTGKDAEDIGKQNEFNAKMQSYQARLSAMNRYWEMMSNIYKTHDQTARALLGNLR
ncbi:MAG: hypothetical protein ACOZQL_16730 [Myxococcota bacterium]